MKTSQEAYLDFIGRLTLLIRKNPDLIITTLSNIFTMRLIGNKTHGDLAEIAISEFINQYMYDFKSKHVGKDLFRAKEHEEDLQIRNEIYQLDFAISLKAYGDGPLQLSTDKNFKMFPRLQRERDVITDTKAIQQIFDDEAFSEFSSINVLPLIYREDAKQCNIMVFDFHKVRTKTEEIRLVQGGRRTHPVYQFLDAEQKYICEVRYGDARANALQRGFWTNTKNALPYFSSVTGGWINYSHNLLLVNLFSHALLSTPNGQSKALESLKIDISEQKNQIQK